MLTEIIIAVAAAVTTGGSFWFVLRNQNVKIGTMVTKEVFRMKVEEIEKDLKRGDEKFKELANIIWPLSENLKLLAQKVDGLIEELRRKEGL